MQMFLLPATPRKHFLGAPEVFSDRHHLKDQSLDLPQQVCALLLHSQGFLLSQRPRMLEESQGWESTMDCVSNHQKGYF